MACIYLNFIFEFVVIRNLAQCAHHTGPKLDDSQKLTTFFGSRALDAKRFLESNGTSIPGTYFRLG